MEYDYAVEVGLPVLAFLHKDPGTIPVSKAEPTDQGRAALEAFRKKIENTRHAKYWTSSGELAGIATLGMASLMKIKPRVGWVRADLVPNESTVQEILKLRRKIEELETKIAETDFSPPAGSETLAQGCEATSVHFRYEVQHENGYFDGVDDFSWNDILSTLGPILIDQASEQQMKDKIEEVFVNRCRDTRREMAYGAHMRDEDFQRIKLQLRALGLIQVAKDGRENARARGNWTLTPYGDRVMTQTAAIRSSKEG